MGLRAKFGLVPDPGGWADDVSKAKRNFKIFPERMLVFLSHGLLRILKKLRAEKKNTTTKSGS